MKQSKITLILILLLAVLLIGGTKLYQALTAPAETEAKETAVPRHQADIEPPAATPPPTEAQAETSPAPLSEDLAADFRVLDESGSYVSLSDFFGKPIVVNLWATWCPPCRQELPDFDAAFAQYGDRVQFLMVDLTDGYSETVEGAVAFARDENGYRFPLYFDVDNSAAEAWEVNAIPTTLFIRADGSLLYRQVGMIDTDALESMISQLLESN